jgi:phage repressor protein C with HTH and peptisase S24 domain
MNDEDRAFSELLRLIEDDLDIRPDSAVYADPWLANWIARDLQLSRTPAEAAATERRVQEFGRRMEPVMARIRAEKKVKRVTLARQAVAAASPRVLLQDADTAGYAPLVDLAVAAGTGLELWDEPCDTMVALPPDTAPGEYVALRVAGDSMAPFVAAGDTLLVRLGTAVQPDDIVVVRLPDDGYVVKCASQVTPCGLRLLSFNPAHEPLWVEREHAAVLGVVVARITSM